MNSSEPIINEEKPDEMNNINIKKNKEYFSSTAAKLAPPQEPSKAPSKAATNNENNDLISQEEIDKILNDSLPPQLADDKKTSLYNYEPDDPSFKEIAFLEDAFEKQVLENEKTDEVDLNRNNVKNYNAKDYLPKEVNNEWFNTDFSQAKYKSNDDKLINTEKYIIGVNTVGQSLKNASYDIRGSVNVPKYSVSPWNNSTIEPDYNIKPLC